jgi:hypothetical protein
LNGDVLSEWTTPLVLQVSGLLDKNQPAPDAKPPQPG